MVAGAFMAKAAGTRLSCSVSVYVRAVTQEHESLQSWGQGREPCCCRSRRRGRWGKTFSWWRLRKKDGSK